MRKKILVILAGLMLTASTAMAATLAVPGSYSSIQEALNAAVDGDEVVVGRGIYYENINFPIKKVVLRSVAGAVQTVIDGGKKGPVINYSNTDLSQFPLITIEGFTIQNGLGLESTVYARGTAGGINVYGHGGFTINNCLLTGNAGNTNGGAINADSYTFMGYASIQVNNSTISNNNAVVGGAAHAYMGSSQIWFTKCNILNNTATEGGAFYSGYSSTIRAYDSYVSGNSATKGGAGYSTGNGGSGIVIQNTIVDNNSATEIGGAFYADGTTWLSGSYNTIVKNSAPVGGSFYLNNGLSEISNSIIYGNSSPMFIIDTAYPGSFNHFSACIVEGGVAGEPDLNADPAGVLDADPNFVNYAARNYQLAADSPALDRITNLSLANDITGLSRPQGFANDIGAYERFVLDNVAPTATASFPTGSIGANGYYQGGPVNINIDAVDNIRLSEIRYTINGVETVVTNPSISASFSAQIYIPTNGTYAISYYAVDANGNASTVQSLSFKLDLTAPTVTTTSPASGATGVSTSSSAVLTFSENIVQGSAFSSITLKRGSSTVSSTKSISGNKLTIKPSSYLSSSSTYTVTVPAGAVKDAAGNVNAAYSYTFKTR